VSEGWLGGRDSNPDNVVQRAVNVFRFALVRSVLLRFSLPALRFALVRSGLFLCRMSHCVSGRGPRYEVWLRIGHPQPGPKPALSMIAVRAGTPQC
jgi:hypothetical protein